MEKTCVEDELTLTVTRLNSESKRRKICKSLEKYKADSAGILRSVQDHLDMLETDIEKKSREVETKENKLQVLSLKLGKVQKQIKAAEIESGDKEKELNLLRNQIKSEENHIEKQTDALEAKKREIKAAEIEAGDKRKELDLLRNQIKSEETTLIELKKSVQNTQRELELKKKELRTTSSVFVKHEQQPVAAEAEQFSGDHLMRYEISSVNLGHLEVSNVLRAKRNPRGYVLNLVEGEIMDVHRKKESGLGELLLKNLVLFFEELAEIKKMGPVSTAAQGDTEETALLVTSVSNYKQGPKLFHSLGLKLKIPDYVIGLINNRHYIPAARLVSLFDLKDFSAQNLLMKAVIDLKRSALEKADNKDVGRLKAIVELAADYKLDIDISADLIAKLMFHKENPTPPELHCSVEAPSPSANGGSSGSRVGLQVPKRETKAFVNPSTNGRF
ncbi:unnamed protein product [Arabidopsis thaliana]|uniref:FRIGIDA-like protein n=1 Tax=Arabidopsis thaliana TaxID=3702 RepID=A0A5S9YBD8_ARATH|nr:unnamed protein product [Arabidopsis thaliana]